MGPPNSKNIEISSWWEFLYFTLLVKLKEDEEEDACFIRTLLRLQRSSGSLSRENIKGLLSNVFLTASYTSSITVEWAVAEMMRNPRVMERAKAEARAVAAGQKLRVTESDLQHLPYLKKVVMETLRLHPPIALTFPRESLEDGELLGYHIPARTRVVLNVWAINRDPDHWKEPERFWPERPEWEEEVDYTRHGFCFLPFGGGRRMCPGIPLAVPGVELVLANLLRCFDWEPPEGEAVDMEEKFALSTRKKNPLLLKLIPLVS